MQFLLTIGLERMMQGVNVDQSFEGVVSRFCGVFYVCTFKRFTIKPAGGVTKVYE